MKPTNNLGYLLHHLSFVLDRQSDQVLQDQLGIGFSQYKILSVLKWHAGIQQKQIANYLGQTEASISRQIKIMHDSGLLQSRVSPNSKREHITSLTTKGEDLANQATERLNRYHGPMFALLSDQQRQNLKDALDIMHIDACSNDKLSSCNQ